jgi:parallel beta-helix repeat protein
MKKTKSGMTLIGSSHINGGLTVFLSLVLVCLLAVPIYPHIFLAQDAQSQSLSVSRGVERFWADLSQTVKVPQEETEAPTGYERDSTASHTSKNQPFEPADNLQIPEVALAVSELQTSAPSMRASALRSFQGPDYRDSRRRPPDPHIAVGYDHVGVMVNSMFALYTKDGTLVDEADFTDWWSNVRSGAGTPFDPRIAYDHHADRWLMVALEKDSTRSYYLLSVSQTPDPTGAWWNYRLEGKLSYGGEDTWADYPDLGFDGITDGAIYLTSDQCSPMSGPSHSASFQTAVLNILPKSALYSGSSFDYWRVWGRTNEDGSEASTLRAAHTFGNPGGEFLINSKYLGWDKVTLWMVSPTFPPDPVEWVRQATIAIDSYGPPPNATQLGGSNRLDTLDNRIYNCMYRNGYLYAAFTEAHDWGSGTVASIRYLKINTMTNSADLDERYGADGYYYWFPAIYTDALDNIIIVFACSSATQYAGIRYTGRKTTDTSAQPSTLLQAGEIYIRGDGNRWGDYFGICCDPSRSSAIWIFGEWAKDCSGASSDKNWGTWIGEVEVEVFRGRVFIRPDGSIDPPTAPIQRDGDVYTLTGSIVSDAHGIVIERSNMTLDGNGYALQGSTGLSRGIDLSYQSNVTIKNVTIRSFVQAGIYLWYSSHNIIRENTITSMHAYGILGYCSEHNDIFENNITDNRGGIYLYSETNDERNNIFGNKIARNDDFGLWLDYSSKNNVYDNEIRANTLYGGIRLRGSWGNSIFGNTIASNDCGIGFTRSSYSTIHHNSFIENTRQVYDVSSDYPTILPSVNTWNLSYPAGGNYWSDHITVDDYSGVNQDELGSDGIVDEPNIIDANNQDNYPLTSPHKYWNNPILGDVNKDMKVDYEDLALLEMAYGSTTEKLNWNPNCDLNGDNKIDVSDLFDLAENYGETY